MIDIVIVGLIAALCWLALYVARWPGMIFHGLDLFLIRKLPNWLYRPLIGCAYCSSFWWAVLIFCSKNFKFTGNLEYVNAWNIWYLFTGNLGYATACNIWHLILGQLIAFWQQIQFFDLFLSGGCAVGIVYVILDKIER